MAPRFIERINRKAESLNTVLGDISNKPPSYILRTSFAGSEKPTGSSFPPKRRSIPTPPPRYDQSTWNQPTIDSLALPKGSLILVTGANSFLGMHIVDQLLAYGYCVRGTVRDVEKANWTIKYFEDKYGGAKYSASVVEDMAVKGAFSLAIQGCSGVIHVASVTSMDPDPNAVIIPSIAGALNALEAADNEPSVLRFVYTSAVAAAVSYLRNKWDEISSQSWNMLDFSEAWAAPPYDDDRSLSVFCSSKMQTEVALWKWFEGRKPRFVLNTVLPDTLWGHILDPVHQRNPLSVEVLRSAYEGIPPDYPPCNFVDVEDCALLHIAALILPDVESQRIFAVSTPWNVGSLVQLLQGLYPYWKINTPVNDLGVDQTFFKEAVNAEMLLRRMGRNGWTDMETSVEWNCEAFC